MISVSTLSPEETAKVAYRLGKILKKGDVVCLHGDLGTGKTAFTGGLADALGIRGYITSPTFTIVNEYGGDIPLYHFDVYRIADSEEMFEIGFDEYLDGDGVVVIEWPERIEDILPRENIQVEIRKNLQAGIFARDISIWFIGEKYMEYERILETYL